MNLFFYVIIFLIPMYHSIFDKNGTVGIIGNFLFVSYQDNGISFAMQLFEKLHNIFTGF